MYVHFSLRQIIIQGLIARVYFAMLHARHISDKGGERMHERRGRGLDPEGYKLNDGLICYDIVV